MPRRQLLVLPVTAERARSAGFVPGGRTRLTAARRWRGRWIRCCPSPRRGSIPQTLGRPPPSRRRRGSAPASAATPGLRGLPVCGSRNGALPRRPAGRPAAPSRGRSGAAGPRGLRAGARRGPRALPPPLLIYCRFSPTRGTAPLLPDKAPRGKQLNSVKYFSNKNFTGALLGAGGGTGHTTHGTGRERFMRPLGAKIRMKYSSAALGFSPRFCTKICRREGRV